MGYSESELTVTAEDQKVLDICFQMLADTKTELSRAILGQDDMLEHVIMTIMAGGHSLLVGRPGSGKTVLASSVGRVFGLEENRVQCTPDLMPADILGSEVMEEDENGKRSFRFIKGPIFCNMFLADELNRASPRTQAAFLQAMQEGKVTAGGQEHRLPKPFHVIATQNPIEQVGTNQLPEAQKDRFLIEYLLQDVDREAEGLIGFKTTTTQHGLSTILGAVAGNGERLDPPENLVTNAKDLRQVFNADQLIGVQHLVRRLPIGDKVYNSVLDIVRGANPDFKRDIDSNNLADIFNYVGHHVKHGPGTRAVQSLFLMTRARALLRGDLAPNTEDVAMLAAPVLRHRIKANYSAGAELGVRNDGQAVEKIIERLVSDFVP